MACGKSLLSGNSIMQGKKTDRSGIRTHATKVTGTLNQRLRPLGHPVFLEYIYTLTDINTLFTIKHHVYYAVNNEYKALHELSHE